WCMAMFSAQLFSSPNATDASGLSVVEEMTVGSRSQRSSVGMSAAVAVRRVTLDMASRPIACGLPGPLAIDRHLGVDLFVEIHARQRDEAMEQDDDICRLPARFRHVAGAHSLCKLVELAASARHQRGEVFHLA